MHAYRYTISANNETKPLQVCPDPECGHNLTGDENGHGVVVKFVLESEHNFEYEDDLDVLGNLEDESGEVAKGHHSSTHCNGCGIILTEFEGVTEHHVREPDVVICVYGGVVQDVKTPENISVEIREYDEGKELPIELRDKLMTEGEPDSIVHDGSTFKLDDQNEIYQSIIH